MALLPPAHTARAQRTQQHATELKGRKSGEYNTEPVWEDVCNPGADP